MIWKYLRNFLEIHSSTEEKVSWTHKKAIFLFLLSESYKGFEFCSNTLKIVITVMAQINRGEQELLPPSSWHWLRITFNWEEKRRIFVQKSQHFRMKLLLHHGLCCLLLTEQKLQLTQVPQPRTALFPTSKPRNYSQDQLRSLCQSWHREPRGRRGARGAPWGSSLFQK